MVFPVSMEFLASMAILVNLEIVARPLAPALPRTAQLKINAPVTPHQAMLVPLDPQDPTVLQVMPAPPALMVNQADLAHADHPAHQDHPEAQVSEDPQVIQAELLEDELDPLAPPDPMVIQVAPDQTVNQAALATMAALANLALPVMLVLLADLVAVAVLVPQATLVVQVPPAAANSAHLLVWPQVIKRRHNQHESRSGQCHKVDLDDNNPSHRLLCHFSVFKHANALLVLSYLRSLYFCV